MRLTVLTPDRDVHTGDLTASCMRAVRHRWNGESSTEIAQATLRGLLFARATELILCDDVPAETAATEALTDVRMTCERDGQTISEGATRAIPEILEHVGQALARWDDCMVHLGGGERPIVIGCELPIRFEIDVDGVVQPIASHIDILLRQPRTGTYVIADTKWREEAPTQAYLTRNLQFATYWLGSQLGSIRFPNGHWYSVGEAKLAWVHASYLRPVGRAVSWVDHETGEKHELKKGDARPMDKVVRWVPHSRMAKGRAEAEIADRVRMMRAGFFPTNPDPVGCHLCPCEQWCDRFDISAAGGGA